MTTKQPQNKLVIIGNGFDLAHGLKTSYNDFILWYLNSCLENIKGKPEFNDGILKLLNPQYRRLGNLSIESAQSMNDFYQIREKFEILIRPTNLLNTILQKTQKLNWVDIENEYYENLKEIYSGVHGNKLQRKEYLELLTKLNTEFKHITKKLEEYLSTLDCNVTNLMVKYIFRENYEKGFYKYEEKSKKVLFLNFNYTNTLEKYLYDGLNNEINYIHGQLNNPENPIIFGYGDEIDEYYKKIEELNINEFLTHFKSFGYFKTNNYQNLLSFIDSEEFEVDILGHSCGLSDRVMLNTIFEHDNCKSIQIYYYQKSETENDFTFKTQEISRHFKVKAKFRARLKNFKDSMPLVEFENPK